MPHLGEVKRVSVALMGKEGWDNEDKCSVSPDYHHGLVFLSICACLKQIIKGIKMLSGRNKKRTTIKRAKGWLVKMPIYNT